MVFTNLILDLTGLSPNGEEDVEINLDRNIMWLIQNPQWRSNLHWIFSVNEVISVNFIYHFLESVFNSVLKSLGTYLGLDILSVMQVVFTGASYSAEVYKHSDMLIVDNRSFSIMIALQILRKLYLVIYVWSNSESERVGDKVI